MNFVCREFTVCINLRDVCENFTKTKKQTFKQLHEHPYCFISELSLRGVLCLFRRLNVRTNILNELKIQLWEFFQFIKWRITRDSFKRYSPGSLQFESILALSNYTKIINSKTTKADQVNFKSVHIFSLLSG